MLQKLDMGFIDQAFVKFHKTSQGLDGVLNPKVYRLKIQELRQKFDSWTKRASERQRQKKRLEERAKGIRKRLDDFLDIMENEPEQVHDTKLSYDEHIDDLNRKTKEEKRLMDFLLKVPEGFQTLVLRDLERIVEQELVA